MTRTSDPAQQLRKLTTVAVPLLLVVVVVVFMREQAKPVTGPSADVIAAAVEDPCGLFTSREVGVLIDARIVERVYQPTPPRHVCGYHGDADSAGTVVEVGIVSPSDLRAERGRGFSTGDLYAEVVASAGAEAVTDVGDEAHYVDLGAGELWVRDGELVLSVAVIRQATQGDRDGAVNMARAALGKLAAAAPPE